MERTYFGYEVGCSVDGVTRAIGPTTIITSDRSPGAAVLTHNVQGTAANASFEGFHFRTPLDADGDGTPDGEDVCPDTPLGEMVVPRAAHANVGGRSGCSISQLGGGPH